jgi:hypothetical protein
LLLTQQKFWFEEDAERKIGKVIASVPLDPKNDPMKVAIPTDEAEDTKDADLAVLPESEDQTIKKPAGSDWRKAKYSRNWNRSQFFRFEQSGSWIRFQFRSR